MAISAVLRKALNKWSPHASSHNFNLDGDNSLNNHTESDGQPEYSQSSSHSQSFNTYSPHAEPNRRPFRFLLPINKTQSRENTYGNLVTKSERAKLKSEAKLERAKSKKENKLERQKSKKESKLERTKSKKQPSSNLRVRPVHMERMESFSWQSESLSGRGSAACYRNEDQWDKRSEVSPGNSRKNSRAEAEAEHELHVMNMGTTSNGYWASSRQAEHEAAVMNMGGIDGSYWPSSRQAKYEVPVIYMDGPNGGYSTSTQTFGKV